MIALSSLDLQICVCVQLGRGKIWNVLKNVVEHIPLYVFDQLKDGQFLHVWQHGIIESFRLERSFKIIKSNC